MFGNKKKKTINDDVFGEMENWDGWYSTSKIQLTLWNKIYQVQLYAITTSETEDINENQQAAYKNFKETILKKQKDIEKIMEEYYQIKDPQTLAEKFTPVQLLFGRNGNYGLYVDDNDEICGPYDDNPNMGIAIGIVPELKIYIKEEYDDYVFH